MSGPMDVCAFGTHIVTKQRTIVRNDTWRVNLLNTGSISRSTGFHLSIDKSDGKNSSAVYDV